MDTESHLADPRTLKVENSQLREDYLKRIQYLGILGHELRTPVNYIATGLNSLQGTPADRYTISKLTAKATDLSRLLENLLLMARDASGNLTLNPTELNPYSLITDAIDSLEPMRPKSITLELDIAENLPTLLADMILVQEALINLIGNAYKFCRSTAKVAITASQPPKTNAINIQISDDGIGMSQSQIQQAIRPFGRAFSCLGSKQGTGIGLTVASNIASMHGYPLKIHSDVGKGTIVTLSLPSTDHPVQSIQKHLDEPANTQGTNSWPTVYCASCDWLDATSIYSYLTANGIPSQTVDIDDLLTINTDDITILVIVLSQDSYLNKQHLEQIAKHTNQRGIKTVLHASSTAINADPPASMVWLPSTAPYATILSTITSILESTTHDDSPRTSIDS